ncbi:hypothetical protein SAMN05518801_10786 [Novosphingobium sp. CF614]|uniref:hypothetical protein n=1 Tax=Novosphingobium sp. CF614 TaxID=1884364 RepID=UPI0008EA3A0E|nr:hypothetical protein [Novosphingobium sp. CF614]SFG09343.1 hypothetical protein SAMN05518801_10786 [Novosphingobium sp. CF614]
MTTRRRLVPDSEVRRVIELFRSHGLPIGAVDIRADGVTIHPPAQSPGNAYDAWKAQDQNRERPARRK